MKLSKSVKVPKHISYPVLVVAVLLGAYIVYAIVLSFYIPSNLQKNGQGYPTFNPAYYRTPLTQTQAPAPTVTPTAYTSKKLGVSFRYPTDLQGDHVAVKEIGDKIYIYVDRIGSTRNDDPESGKSVEVLSKDPNDTLEQALQKRYLNKSTGMNCKVGAAGLRRKYYPPNTTYTTAGITTKSMPSENTGAAEAEQIARCLQIDSGWGVYFLADSKHPNKLLLFVLGQDDLPSGIWSPDGNYSYSWNETIQFLD